MSAVRAPYIAYGEVTSEPGYAVSVALDELAAWALTHGVAGDELRDRMEDAIDRAEDEDAACPACRHEAERAYHRPDTDAEVERRRRYFR